jgi:hypothetical protein
MRTSNVKGTNPNWEQHRVVNCQHWRDCGVDNGGCCSIEKYPRPSYAVCLRICDENNEKPQGLGDTVAKVIEKVTKGRIKPKGGGGCGCDKRRKGLNKLIPYKRNQEKGR